MEEKQLKGYDKQEQVIWNLNRIRKVFTNNKSEKH